MELATGIRLIHRGVLTTPVPQQWADLGAGSGFFTRALASILPKGSSVVAVDSDLSSLRSTPWESSDIQLQVLLGDFTKLAWGENFDGILMANALHYVAMQSDFLRKLKERLSLTGRLVIVEYERTIANSWVPHPITFEKLKAEATVAGFSGVEKLEETVSSYDHVMIYSACLIP